MGKQTIASTSDDVRYIAPSFLLGVRPSIDLDITGMHENYIAQKQMTTYLMYRILDKWLYEDELCSVLKYLKVRGDDVIVLTPEEAKKNKISEDSVQDIEKKSDFIHENILTEKAMKRTLLKIIAELGYKWYELADIESVVVEIVGKYIKKKLKNRT